MSNQEVGRRFVGKGLSESADSVTLVTVHAVLMRMKNRAPALILAGARVRMRCHCKVRGEGSIAAAATAAATVATTAATASAATTATAAAVATSATTAAAVAATTAATRAIFLGLGFVDGQCAAVVILTVERGDRGLRFLIRPHLDESEALAAAGITVGNDLGGLDAAVLAEELFQVRAADVVAQVPHVKLAAHVRYLLYLICGRLRIAVLLPDALGKRAYNGPRGWYAGRELPGRGD